MSSLLQTNNQLKTTRSLATMQLKIANEIPQNELSQSKIKCLRRNELKATHASHL